MNKKLQYDTPALKRRDQVPVVCLYNTAVDCNLRDMTDVWFCKRCGWNPEEAEKRKKEIKQRFGIDVSDDEIN